MSTQRLTDEELTRAAMEVYRSARDLGEAEPTDSEVQRHVHLLDSWVQAANMLAAWRRGEIQLDTRPSMNGWVTSALGWAALSYSIPDGQDDVDPVRRAEFFEAIRTPRMRRYDA